MKTLSEQRAFGGTQGFYEHPSSACSGPMRFSVYQPPNALAGVKVPVLYYLAGLTCTEETLVTKAGAQRLAASLGIMLVTCDTSPRAARYPGDDAAWDFGIGAGFYLDATVAPWRDTYRMRSYVADELPALIESHFPARTDSRGIFGHSMGGHGALTLALNNPTRYRSVSAFAPIVAPSQVPWGQKAFGHYLGDDRHAWAAYDATRLVKKQRFSGTILIDQGLSDKFLEKELQPHLFEAACKEAGQALNLRMHAGYDHSYYFIMSFIEDHMKHHASALLG